MQRQLLFFNEEKYQHVYTLGKILKREDKLIKVTILRRTSYRPRN